VAVALLGLLLGPIYPSATVVFARLLPRQLQNSGIVFTLQKHIGLFLVSAESVGTDNGIAIAFISSAGSSGGALAPFVTGIIAQSQGTWVLHVSLSPPLAELIHHLTKSTDTLTAHMYWIVRDDADDLVVSSEGGGRGKNRLKKRSRRADSGADVFSREEQARWYV